MDLPRISGKWIPFKMDPFRTKSRYTRNYNRAFKSYRKRELPKINYADRRAATYAVEHGQGTSGSENERYEEVLAAFEQVIQINPESADAHFGKGAALHFLQREEEAQRAYEQALKLMRKNRAEEAAFEQGGPVHTHDTESPEMGKPIKRRRRRAASDLSTLDLEETENPEMGKPTRRRRRRAASDLSTLDLEDVDLRVRRHRRKAVVEENNPESAGTDDSRESESDQSHRSKSIDRIAQNPGLSAGEQFSPGTVTKRLPEIPG